MMLGLDFETIDVNAGISELLAAVSSIVTVILVYRGQKYLNDKQRDAFMGSVGDEDEELDDEDHYHD